MIGGAWKCRSDQIAIGTARRRPGNRRSKDKEQGSKDREQGQAFPRSPDPAFPSSSLVQTKVAVGDFCLGASPATGGRSPPSYFA